MAGFVARLARRRGFLISVLRLLGQPSHVRLQPSMWPASLAVWHPVQFAQEIEQPAVKSNDVEQQLERGDSRRQPCVGPVDDFTGIENGGCQYKPCTDL